MPTVQICHVLFSLHLKLYMYFCIDLWNTLVRVQPKFHWIPIRLETELVKLSVTYYTKDACILIQISGNLVSLKIYS